MIYKQLAVRHRHIRTMRLRFRIGPFTFGKGGTRLSLWNGGTGVSIPLSKKKGRTFGKVRVGPVSAYFGGKSRKTTEEHNKLKSHEKAAINDFSSDDQLLSKLKSDGVPWRGVQERLKESLPKQLDDRNDIAYRLVPKAMDIVFGKQNTAWKTEKRPSKSGKGSTTWIVILNNV